MPLEQAVRLTEIFLALNLVLQSLEFLRGLQPEKSGAVLRLLLSLLLLAGVQTLYVEAGLLVIGAVLLWRFQGPYNGGSDALTLLTLLCLFLSHLAPSRYWQEIALGYLAFQLVFSYFQSGYIKIINADWRKGLALQDVFSITAYPVSEHLRRWARHPRLLLAMSWAVIVFEMLFPLSLLHQTTMAVALVIAATFHLANACLFGLNRFFWIWPATYPVLFWFQARLMATA